MIKQIIMVMLVIATLAMTGTASEIRCSVYNVTDGVKYWDANNCAAFFLDVDVNEVSETLTAKVTGQSIKKNDLTYTTTGTNVLTPFPYKVVGFMGEKYVAVGGRTNKIAKLIFDMKADDKLTLKPGDTVNLGSGYTLTVNEVDARAAPRQVWFTFKKDGVVMDKGNGEGIAGQQTEYRYTQTVLGDEDTLIFSIFVDRIFSGSTYDMVQLKKGWLIDAANAKEIKVGDTYGSMEVVGASDSLVELKNKNSIGLSKDQETTFMGNMEFRVSKDGTRFYPKIDLVDNIATIIPASVTNGTQVSVPIDCGKDKEVIKEVPVEKIIYQDKIVEVPIEVERIVEKEVPTGVTPGIAFLAVLLALLGGIVLTWAITRRKS